MSRLDTRGTPLSRATVGEVMARGDRSYAQEAALVAGPDTGVGPADPPLANKPSLGSGREAGTAPGSPAIAAGGNDVLG